jgi:SAM-dependent methyltransferase
VSGYAAFAPELAADDEGFEPAFFAELAGLEAQNFWFRARNRLLTWALERYFGHANSLLEIGCGTGFVLSGIAAARPHLRLCASEIHASALRHAAARVPDAELLQLDARRIPFAEEFDVVGAFDVIEHVEDDAAVLREMHRAAVPGGGLLLTVPQHPFLWSEYDVRAHHVRRYRVRELREKLDAAGFEIVRMTSFVSLLLPLMMVSRLGRRGYGDDYDPLAELRLQSWRNTLLEKVLDFERGLIRAGMPLPAGGSLLAVARRRL